jgi:hypothetical protein
VKFGTHRGILKCGFIDCTCRNECEKVGYRRYLAKVLDLQEADLLIVLAVAEKLQPGVYACVMGESSVPR